MLRDFLCFEKFFELLRDLDLEIVANVAKAGCRFCGGRLHRGDYMRKPRTGVLQEVGDEYRVRFSLCCGQEGCRRRNLPPSLRFLGRRVYLEVVILLGTALLLVRPSPREAVDESGVPRRTLGRWLGWWQDAFTMSRTWMETRARMRPPTPDESNLPASLLATLGADPAPPAPTQPDNVVHASFHAALLLAPVTSASIPDGSQFLRGLDVRRALETLTQKMALCR